MYLAQGQGQTTYCGHFVFKNVKYSVNVVIYSKVFPLNDFLTVK